MRKFLFAVAMSMSCSVDSTQVESQICDDTGITGCPCNCTGVCAKTQPTYASLSLRSPITNSGNLEFLTIRAKIPGVNGNNINVTFVEDALTPQGEWHEEGNTVEMRFIGRATTIGDLFDLFRASEIIDLDGWYNSTTDTIENNSDEFSTNLTGGSNGLFVCLSPN